MSSEDAAHDVSQVSDFHFFSCRKFRIFGEKASGDVTIRNRLVSSSHLGITFALISSSEMTCFATKSLLTYKLTKENMNTEVTDLPGKILRFSGISKVNDIGINSDGTLLAILHTQNSNVSVDVFDIKMLCSSSNAEPFKPICSTRIGTEQDNEGSCLEWNPAFADTLAASSTDRSLVVVKINVENPANQKLIGFGKFGAIATAISWSPKGKQLTIGDSTGKVVQLKPELDVVRSQMGPDHKPGYGKVTGLCWLATTEWLVSFETGTDHDTYLMRCKKDKPTEWVQFHELSYTSSKWNFRSQLFPATQLLLDWNVVIVGNSKTSEISTVGKREDWKTWVPSEGESIYLPTTSDGKDTVPVGVTVDRSMSEEVSLKADGSQKHRPSPLVLCLTNDGILTAHHVISTFAPHNSCQIVSQNTAIVGLSKLEFTSTKTTPVAPTIPSPKPSTVLDQKPKTETSSLFSTSTPATSKSAASAFGGTPSTGIVSSPATKPAAPTATHAIETPKTPELPKQSEEEKKAQRILEKKLNLYSYHVNLGKDMKETKDDVMKMSFATGSVKNTVLECSEVIKSSLGDCKEVMEELKNLIASIERFSERTQHNVKEMDFEIDEKMELVEGIEDGERIIEKLRNISETEKLMRFNKLETSADLLSGKFEDCNDLIKKLRASLIEKETLQKQSVLSPLRHNSNLNQLCLGAENDVALKVLRNVSKIIIDIRERIQKTELEFMHFQRDSRKNTSTDLNTTLSEPTEMSILEENENPSTKKMTDGEIVKARKMLMARIQKRGIVKIRNVNVESIRKPPEPKKKLEDSIDTSNLSNAIMKLSMTPRRVMTTSSLFCPSPATPSNKKDATTQADEAPIVKTVVVTVESPARPIQSAPVVSAPTLKPSTTQSIITTTPKAVEKQEELKQELNGKDIKANAPASTIFSGSLFGTKLTQPSISTGTSPMTSGKSSIFGTLSQKEPEKPKEVTPSTPEDPKTSQPAGDTSSAIEEKPKETVKQEPENTEERKGVEPSAEVTEERSLEPKTPVKDEKVEETTQKTPSFSFNTTTTPQSTTSVSSIFGGGNKTPSSANSSSIFGGAAKSTPAAPSSTSSSIFGGGAKSSPFGSFGQQTAPNAAASNATAAAAPVTFSFNTSSSTAPTAKPGFGSFGASTAPVAKPSSVFGSSVAPVVPNVDDGMEDDSMANAGGGSTGFMSGLGSSRPNAGSSGATNPFAPKAATGPSTSSWLFGGGSGANQQQQQQKPTFSFNTSGTAASATSNTSVFGGGPKFGTQPVFGAKPFGGGASGGLSKNASIFGGATTSNTQATGGGFAQFANKGPQSSSLFGGGAAAAPAQSNTSIFGGGAQATPAPSNSIFGGGSSTNKPSTFTSWR